MTNGVEEIDLHGLTAYQAKTCIDARLRRATKATYRLRLIHGYHGGTQLQRMIRATYAQNPKVLRVEIGLNPGETDLVLREY